MRLKKMHRRRRRLKSPNLPDCFLSDFLWHSLWVKIAAEDLCAALDKLAAAFGRESDVLDAEIISDF